MEYGERWRLEPRGVRWPEGCEGCSSEGCGDVAGDVMVWVAWTSRPQSRTGGGIHYPYTQLEIYKT
jgi:hypothetical protein